MSEYYAFFLRKDAVSERYKQFVREQDCCACLNSAPSEPHHLESGKTGGKKSDYYCCPLCNTCHRYYHDHGQRALERKHRFSLYRQALFCLERYLTDELNLPEIEDGL